MRALQVLLLAAFGFGLTFGLEGCFMCADCNCGAPLELVVGPRSDAQDLVGAEVDVSSARVEIRYRKDGVRWTVDYAIGERDSDTGS